LCGVNVSGLAVESTRFFQASSVIIQASQFVESKCFPSVVLLLHLQGEGLPIGVLGLVKLLGSSMQRANLMPDGCHGAWLAQGGEEGEGFLVGYQGVFITLLVKANCPELASSNCCTPLIIQSFRMPDSFLTCGRGLLQPPQIC
jgi:hypothetical protein